MHGKLRTSFSLLHTRSSAYADKPMRRI